MKKVMLAAVFMLFNTIWATGWVCQFPKPTFINLTCADYVGNNRIVAAGEIGTIMISEDAGANWSKLYIGQKVNAASLNFTDTNTGWLIGSGKLFKSSNGGNNWLETSAGSYVSNINCMSFISNSIGYIGGSKVYKTINGANDWSEMPRPSGVYSVDKLNFIDSDNGWMICENKLFKTNNGANSWLEISIPSDVTMITAIKLINSSTCFIGVKKTDGNYAILKTTNSGNNWFSVDSCSDAVVSFEFPDNNTGYAITRFLTSFGDIIKSTDGGNNWSDVSNSNGFAGICNAIAFKDGSSGISVGNFGNICKTDNGSNSWSLINYNFEFTESSIDFINENTGFLSTTMGFYKTENSGTTWTKQPEDQDTLCYGKTNLLFVDANNGYAIGHYYNQNYNRMTGIAKTTNGGLTWQHPLKVNVSEYGNGVNTIFFFNSNIGWAGGSKPSNISQGSLYYTNNSGANWTEIALPSDIEKIKKIYFSSASSGWMLAGNKLYKTSNGGVNWTEYIHNQAGTNKISYLFFLNAQTGWFNVENTYNSSVTNSTYKTINAGQSWSKFTKTFPDNFVFKTESKGWFIQNNGNQSAIGSTNDGGLNWQPLEGPAEYADPAWGFTTPVLWSLKFDGMVAPSENTLFFTANSNSVFRYSSTSGIEDDVSQKTNELLVSNYPNPFNPETKINYTVPSTSLVKLAVYNAKGELVKKLVSCSMQAGSYNVKFDGSELNSGVYFYRLECGGKSVVSKMMLIK